jgi:hypothetical protein
MGATDTVKDLLSASFASQLGSNVSAQTEVAKVFTDTYQISKTAADATNSTATAATGLPPTAARNAGVVKACYLNSSAAITADATNNAVFTLKAYPAAGVTGVTIATYTTTTAITAFARTAMTLATTATNLTVVAGSNFTLEIAKGGTGITLPILSAQIEVEAKG